MGATCGSHGLSEGIVAAARVAGGPDAGSHPRKASALRGAGCYSLCCCKPRVEPDAPAATAWDAGGGCTSANPLIPRSASEDEIATPNAAHELAKAAARHDGRTSFLNEVEDYLPVAAVAGPADDTSHLETSTCTTELLNAQGTRKLWRRPTQRVARAISKRRSVGGNELDREVEPAACQYARIPTSNPNVPRDYAWLEETLKALSSQEHRGLGCRDAQLGTAFSPIFFVIGGCPNLLCGMQAVMYCVADDGEVDFWWVKPTKAAGPDGAAGLELDRATLSRHTKGPHKNDPGRSKPFYKPLADLFAKNAPDKDGIKFGIEQVKTASGARGPRAFLEQEFDGKPLRMYLLSIWQEDWPANPFARSKYIKGKLVYQKDPEANCYYTRQYSIVNGRLTTANVEDLPFSCVIPGDDIKDLRDYPSLH
mmetsp:Transcript_103008/g.297887  ORF Transcript_103008/g.297887 Transcript_103008/m.297887 type:complete len:424 (-) Transcript_103008:129-1400(-)